MTFNYPMVGLLKDKLEISADFHKLILNQFICEGDGIYGQSTDKSPLMKIHAYPCIKS